MRNTFLVCYDICDDRRLAKVHKTMRGFGDHLQHSIFECQFNAADLARPLVQPCDRGVVIVGGNF